MRILLTQLLLLLGPVRAAASELNDAASMLSRFPQGGVPTSLAVVNALSTLSDSGSEEHVGLLGSLIADESVEIRLLSEAALHNIASRNRRTLRDNFQPPSDDEVATQAQHMRQPDQHFGRHERQAVAYASLTLGDIPDPGAEDWRDVASALEDGDDPRGALRSYALAAATGQIDAFTAIQSFGVDAERLVLGLWTSWCPDENDASETLEFLVEMGSIQTVRVLANRAVRSRAYHRAIALDALSRMLAEKRLNQPARLAAWTGLETGTRDPQSDVRELARAALHELEYNAER